MPKKRTSLKNEHSLLDFLDKKKRDISPLLILTHDYPDPDAMASAYALQYLAEQVAGIRSRIVYQGIIGRIENRNMVNYLDLPVHRLRSYEIKKHAHVALVDTQPAFENNPFPESGKATIVIDQHSPLNEVDAELAIIDTRCGATSVILARALMELNRKIPERLATALAYGIIADTMNLYRVSNEEIIHTYLRILPFANMHTLARIQTPLHEKGYFTTLADALRETRMSQGFMVCHLGAVSSPDTVSEVADFLLRYKQAMWVLITGRFRSKLHMSLRTRNSDYPASRILRRCVPNPDEAGGHGKIAGGSIKVAQPNERRWREEEARLQDNMTNVLKLRRGAGFYSPFRHRDPDK